MKKPITYRAKMAAYTKRRCLWRKMVADGLSMAEIGRLNGISRQAVRAALRKGP